MYSELRNEADEEACAELTSPQALSCSMVSDRGRLYLVAIMESVLTTSSSLFWQRENLGVSWNRMTVQRRKLSARTTAPAVKYT